MNDFTMAELGVFIGVVGGVMTSLILTVQKSRCETIDCCGIKCKRVIKEKDKDKDKEEEEEDLTPKTKK
jgi:hypothetical protein